MENQNENYDKQILELMENDDVKNLINDLENVEREFKSVLKKYSEAFSKSDKKQQDILHYIEFRSLSSVGAYKLSKELQKVRKERRKCEDVIALLNDIGNGFAFFGKKNISNIINTKKQCMRKRKYIPRYYNVRTLDSIGIVRRKKTYLIEEARNENQSVR